MDHQRKITASIYVTLAESDQRVSRALMDVARFTTDVLTLTYGAQR